MIEAKILSAFAESRKEYESAHRHVRDLSPQGRAMMDALRDYYDNDPEATYADMDIIRSRLERQFRDVPRQREALQEFFVELSAQDVSTVNVTREVLEAERDRRGFALADAILKRDRPMVGALLTEYNEIQDAVTLDTGVEEVYTGLDLAELEARYSEDNLIRVAPTDLNRRLRGGCIGGHHLVLAALPEVGKSLFAIHMTGGFCAQGLKTLYVGNEDPIEELVLRLLSNISGVPTEDLFTEREVVMERARRGGYDNVTFAALNPGSLEEIEALLRKDDYDVLVIDQLRNIKAKAENNTTRLDVVAQGVRALLRKYGVFGVSVTQGAESGRDKLVLNSGDIDGSNIGIPGACDIIAMVGMNDDYYERDLRKVTLAKNKRGGNHDSFTVAIDRYRSRIRNFQGLAGPEEV